MDTIFISGITASTVIGVYNRERDRRQKLVIDLELECDTHIAGRSDNFADAIDYDAVTRLVLSLVEGSSFKLIESVAEVLAENLLAEFQVSGVVVSVSKPAALLDAHNVGVRIYRSP